MKISTYTSILFLLWLTTIGQAQVMQNNQVAGPVMTANVLYNCYSKKTGTVPHGHVTAVRVYDPTDPGQTEKALLWDAGVLLENMNPAARNIHTPKMSMNQINDMALAMGDGQTLTFLGTLNHPVWATSVLITDQQERFIDEPSGALTGTCGGTGVLNRSTGDFEITFNTAPGPNVPILCSYTYYVVDTGMQSPNPNVIPTQCPMTHAAPSPATPPGKSRWAYGTDITQAEQDELDLFIQAHKDRHTLLYVVDDMGMLHAFDAGHFCWGDNPETLPIEQRGFFAWDDISTNIPLAAQWAHILSLYPTPPPEFRWKNTRTGHMAPDYGSGMEEWVFISPSQLALLDKILTGQIAAIQGPPVPADVYFGNNWRTVLLYTGDGSAGAISCLDVTDPGNPEFLWEYIDPDLVRTKGPLPAPQVGITAISGMTRWVMFMTSGEGPDPDRVPSLSMIDISSGTLIHKEQLLAQMDQDQDGKDDNQGGISLGSPAIVDSDGNGYLDRIYVTTDKGFVFKINIPDKPGMSGSFIEHCLINTSFSYVGQKGNLQYVPKNEQYLPIQSPATVVVQNSFDLNGNFSPYLKIVFGTAATSSNNAPLETNYLFSYADRSPKDVCNAADISLEWFRELTPGQYVLGAVFVSAGSIYFGANDLDPNAGPKPGHFYSLDGADGTIQYKGAFDELTAPPVIEDGHVFFKTVESDGEDPVILGPGSYNNERIKGSKALAGIQAWKEIW